MSQITEDEIAYENGYNFAKEHKESEVEKHLDYRDDWEIYRRAFRRWFEEYKNEHK